MSVFDRIIETARRAPARIVLSEGDDPRVIEGALRAAREGIAHPVLLARGGGTSGLETLDPATAPDRDRLAAAYHELRRHRGVDMDAAREAVLDPLVFAALMVREGAADGTIGGAVYTTADTVRAALQIVGKAPGVATASSFFLMLLEAAHHPKQGAIVFADCGLVVEPSPEELAQIAMSSAESFAALTGETPRVAMLSFSTLGSARHARVTKVQEATAIVRASRPGLVVDGEMQFDAAFVPEIGASKAPGSPLKGDANVFVFPSLEAGNAGYKIAQRIGGAAAIGPILQGLNRPANDLSRGCSAEDVYRLLAVTGAQAGRGG